MKRKNAFRTVTLVWVGMCVIGALPFVLSGTLSPLDALFESVSGFTTTGLTVIPTPELLPAWLLVWRAFTHWVGGMGVLALLLAIIPHISGHPSQLLMTEAPGPVKGKLVTKAQDTALLLYGIYFAITIVLFLLLIIGGMSPLDSICHTFSTVGTGGFSTRSASTAYYGSAYIDTVLTVFMMICSVNFNIYFLVICGKLKEALKSEELRWLFIIYAVSGAVITFDLTPLYGSFGETLRYAAFQSASAMSTTGFASTNYGAWKHLAQAILIALMFVGGSAGSTAGGFKISRVLLIGKYMKRELSRTLHPKQVAVFRLEGSPVQEEAVRKAALYFSCYIAILFFSTIIICFDRFSLEASFLTVVSSFNNVGLSWGEISSTADFSVLSKLVLITDMLLGRLEILPIFLALSVSRH